jgi:hypothetical protein
LLVLWTARQLRRPAADPPKALACPGLPVLPTPLVFAAGTRPRP